MAKKNPLPDVPDLGWEETTQITEVPQLTDQESSAQETDDFIENVERFRDALKSHPTLEGYMTLVGIFLDKGEANIANKKILDKALDEADKIAAEYREWKKSKNGS